MDDAVLSAWSATYCSRLVITLFSECDDRASRMASDARALSRAHVGSMLYADLATRSRPDPLMLASVIDSYVGAMGVKDFRLYAPVGMGYRPHGDHSRTRKAAQYLARQGWKVWLYADWPYWCTPKGIPWHGGAQPGWTTQLALSVPELQRQPDVDLLLEDTGMEAKKAAMMEYASELFLRPMLRLWWNRGTWTREAFWRIS